MNTADISYLVWREPDKLKGARLVLPHRSNRGIVRSWELYHRDCWETYTDKLIAQGRAKEAT